jgi:hypothetical protein
MNTNNANDEGLRFMTSLCDGLVASTKFTIKTFMTFPSTTLKNNVPK